MCVCVGSVNTLNCSSTKMVTGGAGAADRPPPRPRPPRLDREPLSVTMAEDDEVMGSPDSFHFLGLSTFSFVRSCKGNEGMVMGVAVVLF